MYILFMFQASGFCAPPPPGRVAFRFNSLAWPMGLAHKPSHIGLAHWVGKIWLHVCLWAVLMSWWSTTASSGMWHESVGVY